MTAGSAARRRCRRRWPTALTRTSDFLTHPVFHTHRSETAMMRYLRRLSDSDLALDRVDDPARLLHDEAERRHRDGGGDLAGVRRVCTRSPRSRTPPGMLELIDQLSGWLCEITGYAAVSLQPNAGSQGELVRPAGDPRLPPLPR